ncbi:ABC transporter substrate-binding protein [bacterium]|nr:ABC transporter substrate-binding protein [bacterium]
MVIATADAFGELDPAKAVSLDNSRSLYSVYETLVRPGDRPGQVIPWLAESWQSQENGRIWIFSLRQGILFHDGSEFNAEAVVKAFSRSWGQEGMRSGAYAFHRALLSECGHPLLLKAKALDPHTVYIELRKPLVDFLEILALPALSVTAVPKLANQNTDPEKAWLVGTGPYFIDECCPGRRLVLQRFEGYWHHSPTWKRLVFLHTASAALRTRQAERGVADVSFVVGRNGLERLKAVPEVRLLPHPGRAYWRLVLNCARWPFRDIRCRFGLQYAFDKGALVAKYLGTQGEVAYTCLSADSWAYPDGLGEAKCDLAKARSWFAKAYGKDFDINAEGPELLYDRDAMGAEDCAELPDELAKELSQTGLTASVSGAGSEDYLRRLATGSFQMALLVGERGVSDPDVELSRQWYDGVASVGLVNTANYSSERFIQALNEARTVSGDDARRKAYARAINYLKEGAAEVPLAWSAVVSACRSDIIGIEVNRLNMFDLSEAKIEP